MASVSDVNLSPDTGGLQLTGLSCLAVTQDLGFHTQATQWGFEITNSRQFLILKQPFSERLL